jgi:hypothetical protein
VGIRESNVLRVRLRPAGARSVERFRLAVRPPEGGGMSIPESNAPPTESPPKPDGSGA